MPCRNLCDNHLWRGFMCSFSASFVPCQFEPLTFFHFFLLASNLSPPICHLQSATSNHHALSLPQSPFSSLPSLYKTFLVLQSRFYHYLAFHKYGCLPPPSLPQKDPIFGIDLILQFFRTTRKHRRMRFNQANHARYGNTFQSRPFSSRVVSTIAVCNIQAVFATNMDSFGIGATRYMSTEPLLGHGIISSDGSRWKRSRGLIQPTFARRNLESLQNFEVHAGRMMSGFRRMGRRWV
ncbi:uncharacterized protein K441DRAFT_654251 [Cenococcum geophilum 1.58]|uniref:uncharacterized protein n=1 Tax=Cenococcum geophilum 1.58 TaxID=794803 RepID=UPI00358E7A59|nr:hypothetical protein K441DRAFT_654251 [Cenococcum geophilum 1.58]